MAKVIIFGDSFACDNSGSWCKRLAEDHDIVNYAQAGCSEYRIWQQWQKYHDQSWDHAVICHTSPNRIYCEENFLHDSSGSHRHADLIYQDCKSRQGNKAADHIIWWFENVFDLQQASFHHELMLKHWLDTTDSKVYHMTFFDVRHTGIANYHHVWKTHPGPINHLSDIGNRKVADSVGEHFKKKEVSKIR